MTLIPLNYFADNLENKQTERQCRILVGGVVGSFPPTDGSQMGAHNTNTRIFHAIALWLLSNDAACAETKQDVTSCCVFSSNSQFSTFPAVIAIVSTYSRLSHFYCLICIRCFSAFYILASHNIRGSFKNKLTCFFVIFVRNTIIQNGIFAMTEQLKVEGVNSEQYRVAK